MSALPELHLAREAAEELLCREEFRGLVVLPLYRMDDGTGVYAEGAIEVVRTLREQGLIVSWADEPNDRSYSAKRSIDFVLSLILAIPLGVASSAIWAGLARLFSKKVSPTTRVHLEIVREIGSDGAQREWLTYRGTGEEIAQLLSRRASAEFSMEEQSVTDASAPQLVEAPIEGGDAGPAELHWDTRRVEQLELGRREATELVSASQAALATSRQEAENHARRALRTAAETYWYAERTDRAEEHHRYLHEIGRWTRETFGCVLDFDGQQYSTSCPVKLADKRLGFSTGYVARKFCSICDGDMSECPHRRDRMYWVKGGPTEFGPCRVCGASECNHDQDRLYPAPVVSVIKQIDAVEEVSLVDIPAQPLARLVSIPIGTADLAQALGPDFLTGMLISCDHCQSAYHGLPEPVLPDVAPE